MKKIFYSFLIIAFFFISAGLFGEETGLQIGNAGEGRGTFTFYDVVFGNGMIGILIWGLLFATSTAALAITIRAIWSLRQSRFLTPGFTEQILPLFESKDYQGAYNACVGSPALTKKIVREVLLVAHLKQSQKSIFEKQKKWRNEAVRLCFMTRSAASCFCALDTPEACKTQSASYFAASPQNAS